MGLIFLIPISTAGSTVLSIVISVIWLLLADFKNNWKLIANNSVAKASLFIFALHVVGLLWTENIGWGVHGIKKSVKFLFMPIFMLYVREEHIKYYILAFLLSMIFSALLSYGIWFELISPFHKDATVDNPTPFVSHIIYNPLLALVIYIFSYKLFLEDKKKPWGNGVNIFFIIVMTINMFITGGRSGYFGFFGMLTLMLFQYFRGQFFKGLIGGLIICSSIFGIAYTTNDSFKNRIDQTIVFATHYKDNKHSPVGLRITWVLNGFEVFLKHPLIGVGTGDSPDEVAKVNFVNSPEVRMSKNLHNMYITMMVQFGMVGLFSLLWLFYCEVRMALSSKNDFVKHFGVALPILYFTISFGESYLLIHQTGLLFAVMSAFLYKNYALKI